MACRIETKVINENEYSVTQWNVEKALEMKFELMRAFGPSLGMLAQNIEGEIESEFLSKAVSVLFDKTNPKELTELIKRCLLDVGKNGEKITPVRFNEHFGADDLLEMYKVLIFVIQVNYKNFFPGQLGENLLAKMKTVQ